MRELAKAPKNKHRAIDIEPIQAALQRKEKRRKRTVKELHNQVPHDGQCRQYIYFKWNHFTAIVVKTFPPPPGLLEYTLTFSGYRIFGYK